MKQYTIHANYTGAFPIGFPFEFDYLREAQFVLAALEQLRKDLAPWSELKPFQIWDRHTGRFVA
jgi:hypothetical protein